MEHIQNPKLFIKKIIDSLTPKGRFIIEVPNVDDPLLSVYNIEEFMKFYWYPYHLYYYSKQTLNNIMAQFEEINYKIKLRQRYGLINHLRWFIKGKPGTYNKKIYLLDNIYIFCLNNILNVSDTLIIHGEKNEINE